MRMRAVIPILCALALIGCVVPDNGPPGPDTRLDLKPADLIGAWKDSRRGGVLIFTETGFTGDDLGYMFIPFPDDLPPGFDQKRDRAAGAGRWQLGPALADPHGPNDYVRLNFETIAGNRVFASINKLEAQRRGSAIVLVYYIGDPDLNDRIVYTRCPDCPTSSPGPASS
jgi:hypothetical protein